MIVIDRIVLHIVKIFEICYLLRKDVRKRNSIKEPFLKERKNSKKALKENYPVWSSD